MRNTHPITSVCESVARWIVALLLCCHVGQAQDAPYRNPNLPLELRVSDLLGRMTLEEKVAQLEGAWENPQFAKDPKDRFVDASGGFLPEHAAVLLKNGLGEMSRPSENRDREPWPNSRTPCSVG